MSEEEQRTEEESGAEQSEDKPEMSDADREREDAKEEIAKLEEDPPEKLEDWPKGAAKYETFGGPEGQDHAYHEGPEQKLGPDSLRHKEGGEVEIRGEEVDDPEEYKGEPIPGGPTDPDSTGMPGDKSQDEVEGGAGPSEGGSDEGDSGSSEGDDEDS